MSLDVSANIAYFSSKKSMFNRKRICPLDGIKNEEIAYNNISLLSKFISERGRILPSRVTSVSSKKQRLLKKAIKRARILGLLPFAAKV